MAVKHTHLSLLQLYLHGKKCDGLESGLESQSYIPIGFIYVQGEEQSDQRGKKWKNMHIQVSISRRGKIGLRENSNITCRLITGVEGWGNG